MRNVILLVNLIFVLGGCVNIVQQREETDSIHKKYLVALYENYKGQFLSEKEQHAVLSGYPYAGYDSLKTGGFAPAKINDVGVKSLWILRDETQHPLSWANRPQYGWYTPDQSVLPLRVTPGTYNVSVWGGAYKPKMTLISNVKMEAGKFYVIYSRNVGDARKLSINEYQVDAKFRSFESEYYLVEKSVSDEVLYGNEK